MITEEQIGEIYQSKQILILSGIPTSGKSSWGKEISEEFGHRIISRDDLREKIFGKKYKPTREKENIVTKRFNEMFEISSRMGASMILDNCHTKAAYLDEWISRKPKGYSLVVIFFHIPLWKAYLRNIGRYLKTGKWIPFKVIRDMKKNFDKIDKQRYERIF